MSDVPEAEMFAQFSERLRDWNPSIMRAETVSLPSLLCRNFLPQDGSDKNDLIAVAPFAIPVYLPSEIEKLSKMDLPVSFGSLSFFALDEFPLARQCQWRYSNPFTLFCNCNKQLKRLG